MQMRDLLQSEEFLKLIVIFGAVCTLGSIALGWGGLELGITLVIRKTTKLSPGSTLWENWKNGDAHIKFYLFNITNPEEVATKKVELNEIGPFVYLVEFDKLNMDKNKKIDTILYSPTRTYYFQADKSSGKESDLITFINVPYVAMSHIANDAANSENNNIPEMVDRILTEKGEKLIRTDTVKNFLFDGISVQAYVDLMNDLLVDQESENIHLPEHFKDGLFAIFKGKNGTKDGRWECHSGNRNYADIGKLVSYNGQSRLNLYKDSSCNAINGTDGWIYPPFIEPGEKDLYIFLPELCRSVRWEFVKMTQVEGGIPVARHRFPQIKTFAEDPQVWCFCPKTNVSACDIHGIANLEQCFDGIPLLYSKPHFLNVHGSIRNLVNGIRPNTFVHESNLDVYPLTGTLVSTNIKMQFSIELIPWESMPSFSKAQRAIIPFVWVEIVSSLTGITFMAVRLLSLLLRLLPILRILALLGSLGIVFIAYFLAYRCRKNNSIVIEVSEDEDDDETRAAHELWMKKFKNQTHIKYPDSANMHN